MYLFIDAYRSCCLENNKFYRNWSETLHRVILRNSKTLLFKPKASIWYCKLGDASHEGIHFKFVFDRILTSVSSRLMFYNVGTWTWWHLRMKRKLLFEQNLLKISKYMKKQCVILQSCSSISIYRRLRWSYINLNTYNWHIDLKPFGYMYFFRSGSIDIPISEETYNMMLTRLLCKEFFYIWIFA